MLLAVVAILLVGGGLFLLADIERRLLSPKASEPRHRSRRPRAGRQ